MNLNITYDQERNQHTLHMDDGLGNVQSVVLGQGSVEALRQGLTPDTERQTAMEVQVTALRYANYGDHAQMDHHALAYDPTETVEALVLRGLDLRGPWKASHPGADHIVLRVVEDAEPEPQGPGF